MSSKDCGNSREDREEPKRDRWSHYGGMGVRGKVGSGKMPVAPKAGQVGTAIPHVYQSDGSGTK